MTITDRQRDMLTQLKCCDSLSIAGMVEALQTGRAHHVLANIAYNFEQLVAKGLVMVDVDRNLNRGRGYAITSQGIAALRSKSKHAEPVKYERITPMTQPCYVPPSWGYLRNSGHGHIASRGMM